MTDTAINLVPKQGKLRRFVATVFEWLQAFEHSAGFDYTHDRIDRLERKVAELTEELRESHASSSRGSSPR